MSQLDPAWTTRAGRIRGELRTTVWLVPLIYAVVSVVMSIVVVRYDIHHPVKKDWGISSAGASAALSALGSGMIAFTGFVTSVVLLIVQFGSTQFSPRFLRFFRNEPAIRHALGTFIATFLFALVATAQTGGDVVPYRALGGSLLLAMASVVWFLALLARSTENLRVARAAQAIDVAAKKVFDAAYPDGIDDELAVLTVAELRDAEPVQVLSHQGIGMILQTFDRRRLLRLATTHDATIELMLTVGEHVPTEAPVLRVYGLRPIPERALRKALKFGDERTVQEDPAFILRLLVDLSIKALSPAINDPTTAVQALHRIEDVLRYAGRKRLMTGVVADELDKIRLVYRTPTWDDLLGLALDEIRHSGADQYQVCRRMRAVLLDLIDDLPEHRHAALRHQLLLLDASVVVAFPDEVQRAAAMMPDRQGIGLGRIDQMTSRARSTSPAME